MNVPEKNNACDDAQAHLVNLSSESVAGEEDPGAALEFFNPSPFPSSATAVPPLVDKSELKPGEKAPTGTTDTPDTLDTSETRCRDGEGSS